MDIIDKETINSVLAIGQKYNKNLDEAKLMELIETDSNLKEILIKIAGADRSTKLQTRMHEREIFGDTVTQYSHRLKRFETVFSKTRFQSLPNVNSFFQFEHSTLEKFDLKTYNEFATMPLFAKDENSKRALVEFIAVMGLFEKDEKVDSRKAKAKKLVEDYTKIKFDEKFMTENKIPAESVDSVGSQVSYVNRGDHPPESLKECFKELNENKSSLFYKELLQTEGSLGKKVKDYLQPYIKVDGGYRLKNGIQTPNPAFSDFISDAEYQNLEQQVLDFMHPYQETKKPMFTPNEKMNGATLKRITENYLSDDTATDHLTSPVVHRMFGGCKQQFDPTIYNFIINNFENILASSERQSMVKIFQSRVDSALKFYKKHGNSSPSFLDIKAYCDNIKYDILFGREEFAELAKNAGVGTQEAYEYYEQKLLNLEDRVKTALPRHNKTYVYKTNGMDYQIKTEILRCDDPMNLLVGENKFTNCCQTFEDDGSECLEHAIDKGGILVTYLIDQSGLQNMLTQSWIWTNETKMCLDNVEATKLITGNKNKRLMQDIATYGISQAAQDILKTSEEKVKQYYEQQKMKIEQSSDSLDAKQRQLLELEEFKNRQTLNSITVGEGADDLNVKESFPNIDKDNSGPKGYNGYRDSSVQHIIAMAGRQVMPVKDSYKERAIYSDERRITQECGTDIKHSTLRHITNIERVSHKSEMISYTVNGKPILSDVWALAENFGEDVESLKTITGEDWYYVYSDNGNCIEILDIAKKQPRMEEERQNQQEEMNAAFRKILKESVVINENSEVKKVKKIKGNMLEDTAYLLWLFQKQHGTINQNGKDYLYEFGNKNNDRSEFSDQDQKNIMENIRDIRDGRNTNLRMHEVEFTPSNEVIKMLLAKHKNKGTEQSQNN